MMALNMAVLCCYAMLEYSHCRCPTSHVPHTTDTVPSSATSKALSEAGMHVLCDTLHAMSLYIRCTSVCVWTHQFCDFRLFFVSIALIMQQLPLMMTGERYKGES